MKFLEREVVQANAKVDRVSTKKLDDVISSKKTFSDKTGLGYIGESSSDVKVTKEVKFVKAKDPKGVVPTVEKENVEEKKNMADQRVLNKPRNQSTVRPEAKGRLPPNSQRGPRTNRVCHHCGIQGHTRPNCYQLRALNNDRDQRSRGPRDDRRNWAVGQPRNQNGEPGVMNVMKMIEAFTTCLANFNSRFEGHNSRTQSYRDITPNARDVWVKRGTHACMIISYVHASILPMLRIIGSCILSCIAFYLKHVFLLQVLILLVVIDLIFHVLFFSVFKIQKTHKN